MTQPNGTRNCSLGAWLLAAAIGIVAFVMLRFLGHWHGGTAFWTALALTVVLGLLLNWILCSGNGAETSANTGAGSSAAASGGASAAAPAAAATGSAAAAASTGASTSGASASAAGSAAAGSMVKPSAHLAGEAELADQKGSWKYEDTKPEAAEPAKAETATSAVTSTAAAPAPAASGSDASAESVVKPSAFLAGEAELADQKGTWKYEAPKAEAAPAKGAVTSKAAPKAKAEKAPAAAKPKAEKAPAKAKAEKAPAAAKPKTAAKPKAAKAAPVAFAAVDDAAVEAAGAGTKPKGLKAPKGGAGDDLKLIEGIGPVLEKVCHDNGIFHFDQIAAWGPAEVAWMNGNMPRFKGRVSRDKWVAQARLILEVGIEEFLERAKTNNY